MLLGWLGLVMLGYMVLGIMVLGLLRLVGEVYGFSPSFLRALLPVASVMSMRAHPSTCPMSSVPTPPTLPYLQALLHL